MKTNFTRKTARKLASNIWPASIRLLLLRYTQGESESEHTHTAELFSRDLIQQIDEMLESDKTEKTIAINENDTSGVSIDYIADLLQNMRFTVYFNDIGRLSKSWPPQSLNILIVDFLTSYACLQ